MIEVKELGNAQYEISWDENDPQESMFNHYTEEDFIRLITEYLNQLKENDGKGQDIL